MPGRQLFGIGSHASLNGRRSQAGPRLMAWRRPSSQARIIHQTVIAPLSGPAHSQPRPTAGASVTQPRMSQDIVTPRKSRAPAAHAQAVTQPRQHRSHVLHRQAVEKSATVIYKATRRKKREPKLIIIMTASIATFMMGVGMSAYAWQVTRTSNGQVAGAHKYNDDASQETADGQLIEKPPTLDAYRQYAVGGAQPRYLRIPGIGVNARVKHIGMLASGELENPRNLFDAGWYQQSSLPGESGAMLITAHVSGQSSKGLFAKLHELRPGNIIEIERGDGQKFRFNVVETKSIDHAKLDMKALQRPAVASKPGLTLMTYTHKFSVSDTSHEPHFIVFASQL